MPNGSTAAAASPATAGPAGEHGPAPSLSLKQFPIVKVATVGIIGGILSGLLGLGGGVIMVPLLVLWLGLDQRVAHAASLGAIIPISVAGIATYGVAGEVDLLAALGLTLGAVAGARVGAIALAGIHPHRLQMIFGVFLVLVAIAMVVMP